MCRTGIVFRRLSSARGNGAELADTRGYQATVASCPKTPPDGPASSTSASIVSSVLIARAGLVDQPRALALPGLPDRERGADRIEDHREPPGWHHLVRLQEHAAAGCRPALRGGADVLDADVARPRRRGAS